MKTCIISLVTILCISTLLQAENPWDQLKMERFCRPSSYSLTVNRPGCETEVLQVTACLGVCQSYVQVNWQEPYFTNHCQCCKATGTVKQKFVLKNCKDPKDRSITLQTAKTCSCVRSKCN